jgi:hypothetical protein
MPITVDFTRPPTPMEAKRLLGRLDRLNRQQQTGEFERIAKRTPIPSAEQGLVLRRGFAYQEGEHDADASDRKAPARGMRPPATRITSSRGCALRFELTLLAWVQSTRKSGGKARVKDFGLDIVGSSDTPAWSDVIATGAEDSALGGILTTEREKRARSVRSALKTMKSAGLVEIPETPAGGPKFEDFVLLDERGTDAIGEKAEYKVPLARASSTFTLPAEFISQGWVHVLEDSEIALLLMVACAYGGWWENGMLVMPGAVRLRNYGIHRDPYWRARKTLQWFGLLDVEELGRHGDGRAEDSNFFVNRLRLMPEGFAKTAVSTITASVKEQIARAT